MGFTYREVIGRQRWVEESRELRAIAASAARSAEMAREFGLLQYRERWERREVKISVGGELLSGIASLVHGDTVHLISDDYSYYIPLAKIDYIRTSDGLRVTSEQGG